jgi:hypothetical protein
METDVRPKRAVELRVAGLSRSQIMAALGLRSSKLLNAWLRGVPPPAWTERPNAKDDVRDHAVALRLQGKSYNDIRRELGVSKSTLSLWLRDVPLTEEHRLGRPRAGVVGQASGHAAGPAPPPQRGHHRRSAG